MRESREKIIHRRLNPLLESLPEKFQTIYPNQIGALQEVVAAFEEVDVVVMDAPTGTGKTVLGEMARRLVKADRSLYICHAKALQDQFLDDFDYAAVIKGRGNYATEKYPERFVTDGWSPDHLSCDDCTWSSGDPECDWCIGKSTCPYEVAKRDAIRSELTVANSSYALAEWNYIGKLTGRDLVIADEADTLESALMGFVSVEISRRRMEKWRWEPPKKSTVRTSWVEWLDEKIPVLEKWVRVEREKARRMEASFGPGVSQESAKSRIIANREARYLSGLSESLKMVRKGLEDGYPWVYTGEGSSRDKTTTPKAVSFKPTRVDMLGKDLLWSHGKKWLLMSATVISADELLSSLGWDGDYRLVRVPSTFPIENRKIYPVMVTSMTRKSGEDAYERMGKALVKVCERHPDERVLVHTVSYSLAKYLFTYLKASGVGRSVITHSSSQDKAAALTEYTRVSSSVLLSPSMDRGVDLPGDLCRVQVICKVPFPNLGDKQVSSRIYSPGGQTWYTVQTVRSIVQMTGRAVRSPTDYATTYILDAQFASMIWSKARGMLPVWWSAAVDWREGERLKREILR